MSREETTRRVKRGDDKTCQERRRQEVSREETTVLDVSREETTRRVKRGNDKTCLERRRQDNTFTLYRDLGGSWEEEYGRSWEEEEGGGGGRRRRELRVAEH
jgi:hypothetical protein